MANGETGKSTVQTISETTSSETITNCSTSTENILQTSKSRSSLQKLVQFLSQRHGLVLALITAILFSLQSLFVDILTETLDSFQVGFMQVPIFLICCLFLVLYARISPPRECKHYLWLLGSSLCQAANTCLLPLALSVLTVGDAVTISYTSLIQVGFFSFIILKEPVRLFDLIFALVAFLGVFFVARPPFIFGSNNLSYENDNTFKGVLYAVSSSSTIALFYVFSRKVSLLGINSYFCLLCNLTMALVTSGIITLTLQTWRWPTRYEWLFAVLVGVTYGGGYVTLFFALKKETATLVTVIVTTEIGFAFLWQVVFLHQPPFWTSCVGAILILAACVGITLKNPKLPQSTPTERNDTEEQFQ